MTHPIVCCSHRVVHTLLMPEPGSLTPRQDSRCLLDVACCTQPTGNGCRAPERKGLVRHCWGLLVQMGGAEGVRKAERYALVNGIAGGLRMHAIPRHAHKSEE